MKQIKRAFTLVELIVVITILSVLSTVAFISFQWYTNDAKDATKVSDLMNIGRSIWNSITAWKKFRLDTLQDITYASHPNNTVVKVWELTDWVIPGLSNAPVDPFTSKPYIVWLYANSDNTAIFWQIWGILENRYGKVNMLGGNTKFPANVPVQRVVWNYNNLDVRGISGLIPRWAIEDFEWFKNTSFYSLWNPMYWANVYNFKFNNYIFAMDRNPVQQILWYTDEKTLVYESFENIEVYNIWENWNPKNYPRCDSPSASMQIGFENDSTRVDNIKTLNCSIDRSQGANSNSSLHLNWIRDGAWDGQYSHVLLDNQKKYKMSLDVKWTMAEDLQLWFRCYWIQESPIKTVTLWALTLDITVNPNNFSRISAYVNQPDPYWSNLSMDISSDTLYKNHSCIFFRTWDPKAGEELYFDNYIITEID